MQNISATSFPRLLQSSSSQTILTTSWEIRARKGLVSEHYAALFLDPRKHVRDFVQSDPVFLGCAEQSNRGNTDSIKRAVQVLLRYAAEDVQADDSVVKAKVANGMKLEDAQEMWLEVQMRAFIGVHPKVRLKQLSIQESSLRKCVGSESSLQFWAEQVPADMPLRRVAMRLFSAKPTSVPVERCWSVFGDALSHKRRHMHKGRLARLVHARVNMNHVPSDHLDQASGDNDVSAFESVFEAVAEIDEQEDAAHMFTTRGMVDEISDVEDGTGTADSDDEGGSPRSGVLDVNDVCL
jgi:hypothetical protein